MRPILVALLTAAVAMPSTAFACGMPIRVAEAKVTLADALDAIDDAEASDADKAKEKESAAAASKDKPATDAPKPARPQS